ncbi:cadmium resistance transporter [Leptolyngbya sp. AN02str]|uniref:cadmium resistance transporter n=1 Tax=Leptolyngbya sp. AN02str TaxID=3423363 RepID=UPI003D31BC2A
MSEVLKAISTGFTAFTVTNLDDILILLLFFSQVSALFRRRHIVAGQYLGFAALVLVSLPGFFSSFVLPRPWIGMLGIVPIAIGMGRLINQNSEDEVEAEKPQQTPAQSWFESVLSPQACSVAAVTFANGGDNIGIYVPLFASSTGQSLATILGVFFGLVGVWCYVAYRLMQVPAIARTLTHYGNQLIPFVLIGLGVLILVDSHTLENRGLAVLTLVISGLCLLSLLRNATRPAVLSLSEPAKELTRQS